MGLAITKTDFSQEDFTRFAQRLTENLDTLATLLAQPDFGGQQRSMGAEVELYIIDREAKPTPINAELLAAAENNQLTLELNKYNIEFNFEPTLCDSAPFSRLEQQWCEAFDRLSNCANQLDGRLTTIGILPTLTADDLGPDIITPSPRYEALSAQLLAQRGGRPFAIQLNGPDPLHYCCEDVSAEGANASFQFHYRSPANTWVNNYNAAQLITPLVLAVSGNSPFFLGHRLWHETRVGLFKQSVDARQPEQQLRQHPARVSYGHGWVRQNIHELFAESVALYSPLLPVCSEQDELAIQENADSAAPSLAELRLHHGCIWPWNRAIYDANGGGHIRLEFRALPSGPTAIDMFANAALMVGLIEGIQPQLESLLTSLPFRMVETNFYRAAQSGLNATLLWPDLKDSLINNTQGALATPTPIDASSLLSRLLPIADQGLAWIGISEIERKKYLTVIQGRLSSQQTGSIWQLNRYQILRKSLSETAALTALVEEYYTLSCQNLPVHEWPIPQEI